MKFFVPLVAAFAALTAAAPTSSEGAIAKRETVTIQEFMHDLTSQVKQHTAAINKITAAVPANASDEEKKKSAASAIKEIKAIENIITLANTKIQDAPKQVKRDAAAKPPPTQPTLGDLPQDVLAQLNGKPIVLARLLLPLLQELNPAIGSVLATLYLEEVYVALQPLLRVQLPALVTGLSTLVSGLLAALAPLLTGLGGILGPLLLGLGL